MSFLVQHTYFSLPGGTFSKPNVVSKERSFHPSESEEALGWPTPQSSNPFGVFTGV